MNEGRVLIMHAGGGKAGSSALQSAFAEAAKQLDKVGVHYSAAPASTSRYDITSGNGISLYEKVARPEWKSNIGGLIEAYLGDKRVGICSSEYLGSMAQSVWRQIIAAAHERDIDIKVVYFVRSAVGYIAASYNQDVKRGGEVRSIEEAAPTTAWQHFDDLAKLDKLFDNDHLRVINYDLGRKDIVAAFVTAFPELLPASEPLRILKPATVNRSLSQAELETMRRVNARLGQGLGPEISDRLILDAPELRTRLSIPSETAEILAGKFRKATDWVNERFFRDAASPLRVSAGVSVGEVEDQDTVERAARIVLDWAIDRIGSEQADLAFLRRRLLGIDWHNAADPTLPGDFDPIAYLIVNEDILRSGNPPYEHFINNGSREGRPYRWPVHVDASKEDCVANAIAKLHLEDSANWKEIPVWPRLRFFLQLESILHDFAARDREHLEEIRELQENSGFVGEQFRQLLDGQVAPLKNAIEVAQGSVADAVHDLPFRISADQSRQLDKAVTELSRIGEGLNAEILALRAEQAKLSDMMERKDTELARERELLRRYREASWIQKLGWTFGVGRRP